MKDSRIVVFTNPTTTVTGTTTTTGPAVDLWQSGALVGGNSNGTDMYGIGVEILQTTASGTAQAIVWEFETSADNSTWRKGGFIALLTSATASTTYKARGTLRTQHRYFRLVGNCTGTGTSTVNAYAEDAGDGFSNAFPNG